MGSLGYGGAMVAQHAGRANRRAPMPAAQRGVVLQEGGRRREAVLAALRVASDYELVLYRVDARHVERDLRGLVASTLVVCRPREGDHVPGSGNVYGERGKRGIGAQRR